MSSTGRLDEHGLRALVLDRGLRRPFCQVVVTVADCAAGADGLWSGDFDLLARLPDLARIDLVMTASMLNAGFRERLQDLLPGVEETKVEPSAAATARLVTPAGPSGDRYFTFRDREEELLAVIRQVKRRSARERTAVVFQRPLPYLYPRPRVRLVRLRAHPDHRAAAIAALPVRRRWASARPHRRQRARPQSDRGPLRRRPERAASSRDEMGRAGCRAAGVAGRRAGAGRRGAGGRARRADTPGPSSRLLDCLLRFLDGHRVPAPADAGTASRELRARRRRGRRDPGPARRARQT